MLIELRLTLPDWLEDIVAGDTMLASAAERMRFVIDLSRRNVADRSGGPFAAAVFEMGSGRLVAAGTNRVEALGCSAAHAEVMALAFAQKRARSFDIGALGPCELVSSAQPCSMCFGAILWAGVRRLVYAARRRDVEKIVGFDEGPLPLAWKKEMQKRGIAVEGGFLRREAVHVLQLYRHLDLTVYSPHRDHPDT